MHKNLIELVKSPANNQKAIVAAFEEILKQAVASINSQFAFRKLSKMGRTVEPIPTKPRELSSYRTRLGTILEYALGCEIDKLLEKQYSNELSLTFSYSHEYPDFYLRDTTFGRLLRIEVKCVDCESDEQAARFDVATADIDSARDFALFIGWEWKKRKVADSVKMEHPSIFAYVFLPAIELAKERDLRLYSIGGKIENCKVLVPSTKKPGTYVSDPGNYGKFWRIVPPKRRVARDLSEEIKRFLDFQRKVDKKAPRKRIKK